MKGITNEVVMMVIWIILAAVVVVAFFLVGQFIFSVLQPMEIGTESSGISFDGKVGKACFSSVVSDECAKCRMPAIGMGDCDSVQFVNVEDKFGSVWASNVTVCAVPRQYTLITFKVTYGDGQEAKEAVTTSPYSEACKTFTFPEGAKLREISAAAGKGPIDKFRAEFAVMPGAVG
ncbi:MAG: hypothetical protein QXU82_01480 [Candidatus Aenigmatarchaeota archaeon]